jgi:hypothetical protein
MDKQNKSQINFSHPITIEQATNLFNNKFLELHPRHLWPGWMKSHTDLNLGYDKVNNKCICKLIVGKKKELGSDNWYEEVRGVDVVAGFFPGTRDKCFIINHEPEILIIFSADINLATSQINVLVDLDMSLIDERQLMKLRNIE